MATVQMKGEISCTKLCTLCNLEMSRSKILPCFHSVCLLCLEDANKLLKKGCGDKLPCPICDDEFTIPLEGLSALETNVFSEKSSVLREAIDSRNKGCDACCAGCDQADSAPVGLLTGYNIAENYCLVCQQKLCRECFGHHKKFKTTKEHCVIGINGNRLNGCHLSDVPCLCVEHGLQQELYCTECDKVICSTCFQKSHQNHRMQDVKESSENFKTDIRNVIENLSGIESEASISNDKLEEEKMRFLAHLKTMRKEIVISGDALKELIDEQVHSLLREVDSIEEEREVSNEEHKDINRRLSANLTYISNCCNEILTTASDHEVCWATSKLRRRTEELKEQQLSIARSRPRALNACFQRAELSCLAKEKLCNLVGQLKVVNSVVQSKSKNHEYDVVGDQSRVRSQRQKIREIKTMAADKEHKEISAMAILNEELFLASSKSSTVEVYDTLSLSFRRRWTAKTKSDTTVDHDVDDIRSMGSCVENDSLYILHYKSSKTCEILRTDGIGRTLAHWTTKYGYSLSVTGEGNVVVVNYWDNTLKEYDPSGKLISRCNLKFSGILHPTHAIKLENGCFAVCHGLNSDQLHRVCVVDPRGCLLRSFGGSKGSGMEQMNDPFHLAVDVEGSVFVSDWNNGRVLELGSDMEMEREVLSKEHGLAFPRCICLDEQTSRMFVADDKLKACLVFDIYRTTVQTKRQKL